MKLKMLAALADVALIPSVPAPIEIDSLAFSLQETQKNSLFICRRGMHYDTHADAMAARLQGAVTLGEYPTHGVMFTASRSDIGKLIHAFYGDPAAKLNIVGITGTNGKTTTAYLLYRLCEAAKRGSGYIGTLGCSYQDRYHALSYTTPPIEQLCPLLVKMRRHGVSALAMEVSSQGLEQNRVANIRFGLGVFLNLTRDHLDYHGDMERYFAAKAKLFAQCRIALVNIDDAYGRRLCKMLPKNTRLVTFAEGEGADYTVAVGKRSLSGSFFTVTDRADGVSWEFFIPQIGKMTAYDAAVAVIAAKLAYGITLSQAARYIKTLPAVPGRAEKIELDAPFLVLCDYAHTPDALKRLLDELNLLKESGRLIAVFGCGGERDAGKRPIMAHIGELADQLILTSDNPRGEDPAKILQDMKKGLMNDAKCSIIINRADAIKTALQNAGKGDIVALCGKGHEDYQLIGKEKHHFDEKEITLAAWQAIRDIEKADSCEFPKCKERSKKVNFDGENDICGST